MTDTFDPFDPNPVLREQAIQWLQPDYMDVGCGPNPLPGAKVYYDLLDWDNPKIHRINFYRERLPELYNVYCRNVLEDMHNPEALLEQFRRCERGWLETPSIALELCNGLDGYMADRPVPWKGCAHHFWYTWVEDDTYVFCPKSSVVEYVKLDYTYRNVPPNKWTMHYKWDNYNLKYKILKHDVDFDMRDLSYLKTLETQVKREVANWYA